MTYLKKDLKKMQNQYFKFIANAKFMINLVCIAIILLTTIVCVSALDVNFNNQTPTLLLDFANSSSQSFFVTIPNEYVLSASMDMEGRPTISMSSPPNRSDVMIVNDVSGSMNQPSSKIRDAKSAAQQFIGEVYIDYVHVGLVKYQGCPSAANDLLKVPMIRSTLSVSPKCEAVPEPCSPITPMA